MGLKMSSSFYTADADPMEKDIRSTLNSIEEDVKHFHKDLDEIQKERKDLIKHAGAETATVPHATVMQTRMHSFMKRADKFKQQFEKGYTKLAESPGQNKHVYGSDKTQKGEATFKPDHNKRTVPSDRDKKLVQLFCQREDDLVKAVSSEIQLKLTTSFAKENTDVSIRHFDPATSTEADAPLLVLCINTSRIRSDVKFACQGVNVSRMVALVILHIREPHVLPVESSERILRPDKCDFGEIFDAAYLPDKGFYECEMNHKAFTSIERFIKEMNISS